MREAGSSASMATPISANSSVTSGPIRCAPSSFPLSGATRSFANPYFSPAVFRDFVLPYHRRVAEKITLPWIMHTDGNVLPLIEDILSLGIAGLHPIEKGAMDIRAFKRDYGHRVCVLGNVDLNILGLGTPEDVDAEVKWLISVAGPGGGYIVSAGNSLPNYVQPANVLAMAHAVNKYGAYPL